MWLQKVMAPIALNTESNTLDSKTMKDSKTGNHCNGLCVLAIAFLVIIGTLMLSIFSSAVERDVDGVVEGMFLIGAVIMAFGAIAPLLLPEEDSEESRSGVRNRQPGSNSDQD